MDRFHDVGRKGASPLWQTLVTTGLSSGLMWSSQIQKWTKKKTYSSWVFQWLYKKVLWLIFEPLIQVVLQDEQKDKSFAPSWTNFKPSDSKGFILQTLFSLWSLQIFCFSFFVGLLLLLLLFVSDFAVFLLSAPWPAARAWRGAWSPAASEISAVERNLRVWGPADLDPVTVSVHFITMEILRVDQLIRSAPSPPDQRFERVGKWKYKTQLRRTSVHVLLVWYRPTVHAALNLKKV